MIIYRVSGNPVKSRVSGLFPKKCPIHNSALYKIADVRYLNGLRGVIDDGPVHIAANGYASANIYYDIPTPATAYYCHSVLLAHSFYLSDGQGASVDLIASRSTTLLKVSETVWRVRYIGTILNRASRDYQLSYWFVDLSIIDFALLSQ